MKAISEKRTYARPEIAVVVGVVIVGLDFMRYHGQTGGEDTKGIYWDDTVDYQDENGQSEW